MNLPVGLFVALIGLFAIWLWSTGRAQAVWQDLWSGSAQSGYSAGGSNSNTNPVTSLFMGLPVLNPGYLNFLNGIGGAGAYGSGSGSLVGGLPGGGVGV